MPVTDTYEWPTTVGFCLTTGGHVNMPVGGGEPKFCARCGRGYDPMLHEKFTRPFERAIPAPMETR